MESGDPIVDCTVLYGVNGSKGAGSSCRSVHVYLNASRIQRHMDTTASTSRVFRAINTISSGLPEEDDKSTEVGLEEGDDCRPGAADGQHKDGDADTIVITNMSAAIGAVDLANLKMVCLSHIMASLAIMCEKHTIFRL